MPLIHSLTSSHLLAPKLRPFNFRLIRVLNCRPKKTRPSGAKLSLYACFQPSTGLSWDFAQSTTSSPNRTRSSNLRFLSHSLLCLSFDVLPFARPGRTRRTNPSLYALGRLTTSIIIQCNNNLAHCAFHPWLSIRGTRTIKRTIPPCLLPSTTFSPSIRTHRSHARSNSTIWSSKPLPNLDDTHG